MTQYVETEYLLAIMDGDYSEAERLIRDMLPGERSRLHRQLLDAAGWMEGYR